MTAVDDAIAVEIWDVFDQIGYAPHEGQIEVHNSTARNRVVAAGRRFGKSEIGGHELVPEALLTYGQRSHLQDIGKRREFWIVGPEYSDSEKEFRIVWNELKKFGVKFDKPGSYNDPIFGNLHLSAFEGLFQVHGKSAKHPETLVGEGLSGVVLAEAAKLKERVWTKFIRPTLADFEGWSIMTSTPEGKNWFYNAYRTGQDDNRPDWDSWRMPAWRNPYVYKTRTDPRAVKAALDILTRPGGVTNEAFRILEGLEIDAEIMASMLDSGVETFKQEYAADFTEFVGRVFKDFDEEVHTAHLSFNPKWQTYAAVDYGFTNPTVWLLIQLGPWGEIHILREYYERGRTTLEAAKEIQARGLCPPGLIRFYPDPASPGDTKELSDLLKVPFMDHGTGGELRDRIQSIRNALKFRKPHLPEGHPERKPQLIIDKSCTMTIRDFNDYRYPKSAEEANMANTNLSEAPLKKDDHAPEALGRFFAGHYGPRSNTKRQGTVIRRSNLG